MKIELSDHFTYKRLFLYTVPSVAMMIFTSIYGVVDGVFVSNFVGKTPFAAVNFIMPFLIVLGTLGFMFGTGGSALISKTFGEGDPIRANHIFSLLLDLTLLAGVLIAALGILFLPKIAALLGAEGKLLDDAVLYGRVVLLGLPALMLQYEFQSFFATAQKPHLGLVFTLAAGGANMILDALFVGLFRWGLVGAASATVISQCVGGLLPLLYFALPNRSLLRFGKTGWDGAAVLKTCANGSSELLANISMSLVSMLYNARLIRFAGEDGVAAYGVLMYVSMIFFAIFIGYAVGVAPVVGYHFGAKHRDELRSLLGKSLIIIGVCSALMFAAALLLARPLSAIFVGYDEALFALTVRGFGFFAFSFLFSGIAIFGSSFFTALNNGMVSALISFLRTLVFQIGAVLLLPLLFGIDGIWLSLVVAELMAAALVVFFLFVYRKRYGYMGCSR